MEDGQRARLLLSGLGRNFVREVSLSRMGRELGSRCCDWAETSFEKSSLSRWAETSCLVVVTGQKLLVEMGRDYGLVVVILNLSFGC